MIHHLPYSQMISEQEYYSNILQSSNIIEETMSIYRRKYSQNIIIVINDIIITI